MAIKYNSSVRQIDWTALADLYRAAGMGIGDAADSIIRKAFEASDKVVTAWDGAKLIAAGRMLTDGVRYASIFDVAVLPDYQKQGIGKGIMMELMKGREELYIHLTSTSGNEPFYCKLGFRRHRTAMARYPHDSEYLE